VNTTQSREDRGYGIAEHFLIKPQNVRKMTFSIKIYVTLSDYLKIPQVSILGDLHCLKDPCFFFQILVQATFPMKIACQTVCPNPSPKPFSQSREIVNI
jgi:hypothetical protein